MNEVEILRQEVERLSREVEAQRVRRGRRNAAVFGLGLAAVLVSVVASAADYECTSGPLGRGFKCFVAGQPALAREINGNFHAISGALDGGEIKNGLQDALLTNHGSRLTALEGAVAQLQVSERVVSGRNTFPNPQCSGSGNACRINFPANTFTQQPHCSLTMVAPDTSGYQENMLILETYSTHFMVWEGTALNAGSTMVIDWVCAGR